MAKHILTASLTKGEVTPLAHARHDKEFYRQAAHTVFNWITLKFGGVTRRPGTRYLWAAKFFDKITALYGFTFSNTQSYIIEAGHNYFRFAKNRARILSSGNPYEIVTPWSETQVKGLRFSPEINDVVYITHSTSQLPPKKLSRLSDTNWTITDIDFQDGPYEFLNDQPNTATTSAAPTTGGTTTVTFQNTLGINRGAGFQATDVGRHIRIQIAGKYSWGKIASVVSTTVVTVLWSDGQGGTTASLTWQLGAFSATTGYPRDVQFQDGRLIWGGTLNMPRGAFASMTTKIEKYSPTKLDGTVTDAEAYTIELNGGGADPILWMVEAPRLQIGTGAAIRTLGGASTEKPASPSNLGQRKEVNNGAADVAPIQVGPSTIYAGRGGTTIFDLFYDYQVNGLISPELSTLSQHLFKFGVSEFSYAQYPLSVLWTTTKNGKLVGTTYERYEKVIGYHRHDVGGLVTDIETIPDGDRGDDTYLLVERTIDGQDRVYVEVLEKPFDPDLYERGEAFYVDSGVTVRGTNLTGTTAGDVAHLVGKTVEVVADGAVLPQQVVQSGQGITLPGSRKASTIVVGLPIENSVVSLPVPDELPDGSTLGSRSKISRLIIKVHNTAGLLAGAFGHAQEIVKMREPSNSMNQPVPLYSGICRVKVEDSWDGEAQWSLSAPQPTPATVLAVRATIDTEP